MCTVCVVWGLILFCCRDVALLNSVSSKTFVYVNLSPLLFTSSIHLCLNFPYKREYRSAPPPHPMPQRKNKNTKNCWSFRIFFLNVLYSEALLPGKNMINVFLSPKGEALLLVFSAIVNNRETVILNIKNKCSVTLMMFISCRKWTAEMDKPKICGHALFSNSVINKDKKVLL